MKHSRQTKRASLALLLAFALLLSGCYADTPSIEGSTGDIYPEYPTQSVATDAPTADPQQNAQTGTQQGGTINLPSSAPSGNPVINVQTPVVLNTSTVPPATVPVVSQSPATATPSNILKLGAKGSAVTDLQKKLKALGYYTGSADGDFGEGTEAAVKAFQKQMGLSVDGVAGLDTLRKLANTTATKKPEITATPTPRPTSKPEYSEDTYLKVGSSGSLVTKMQNRLIELGYLSGTATGKFDQATENAVIAFQKRNCSYYDGIAGKITLDAMFSSSAKRTSSSAGVVGQSLKKGSEGDAVRALQSRLKELGYYDGSVDGDFGESTEDAVKAFQKQNGLTVDGKAGGDTTAILYSSSAEKAGSDALKKGSTGTEVVTLQNRLKKLGYYTGTVDGDFGESTEDAVKAFQKRNGLTADGKVGDYTASKLYSSSAIAAEEDEESTSLKEGSTGEEVVRLQSKLKMMGYYTGNVDGDFGESTKNAVRAFQRANGLTVDGKAGERTLEKLYGSTAATAKPSSTATPLPDNVYVLVTPAPDGSYVTLERGHYGNLVRTMQEELRDQGYFNGTCDGYYGEGTEEAVMKFQGVKGLKVDGKAGPATLRVLYEGNFPIGS